MLHVPVWRSINSVPRRAHSTNRSVEIHLLDFNDDLRGEKIKIEILESLRDDRTFPSPKELIDQILLDKKELISLITQRKI